MKYMLYYEFKRKEVAIEKPPVFLPTEGLGCHNLVKARL